MMSTNADGRNFVCSPPPSKDRNLQNALWDGLRRGDIQTVATDHCPVQSYERHGATKISPKSPTAAPGVENMYPYMLSQANRGVISCFNKAVEVCASNAYIFACDSLKVH